jgi:hypothetical protein
MKMASQPTSMRCLACASSKRECLNVHKAEKVAVNTTTTPRRSSRSKASEVIEEGVEEREGGNEDEDLEITPPKAKKGLLESISSKLTGKRKTEGPSSRSSSAHYQIVEPRFSTFFHPEPMGPPLSTSPSFSSLESRSSDPRHAYQVDHLTLMLSADRTGICVGTDAAILAIISCN